MVAPTGAGKTVMFVKMAAGFAKHQRRTIILVHRQELIKQTSAALLLQGVRHGIIAPGYPETNDFVQVAMVQTLARRLHKWSAPDLLVIDECHHGVAGTWRKILDWARGKSKVIGVTATPQRGDGKGLGDVFDCIVVGPTVKWLTTTINPDTGLTYLSPPRVYAPPQVVDLSELRTRFGDYAKDDLEDAVDRATVTGDAVEHYKRLALGMPAVAFCVSIKHAEHVAEQFRLAGIPAISIDGSLPDNVRADRLKQLEDGRVMVLTSCDLISEGFDLPKIGAAILLRPTQSLSLYLQQVGRALRPCPGKEYAVILDHVGNCLRHGMPDEERTWSLEGEIKKKRKKVVPLVKTCEKCFAAYKPGPPKCPVCGHQAETTKEPPREKDGELVAVTDDQVTAARVNVMPAEKKKQFGRARTLEELYAVCDEFKQPRKSAEIIYVSRLRKKMTDSQAQGALQIAKNKIQREKQEKADEFLELRRSAENLKQPPTWADNVFEKRHGKHALNVVKQFIHEQEFAS